MRVGILTSVGRTIDAFFVEIVRDWEQRGHTVFTAAGSKPTTDVPFDLIEGLGQRPQPSNLVTPWRISAWARTRELDVVLTNTATASTLARIPRMPCKVVYFCHGLHWNAQWHPAQVVEHVLARRSDSIIAINSDDYDWLSRRHPRVRLLNQGVGVPDDRYTWSPVPSGAPLRLVWAGDFVERKRPADAVRVVDLLSRADVDAKLTMLGDGVLLGETMELATRLGMGERIAFPGRMPVEQRLHESHALLHTAAWEGLPRILLEGLVMGRRAFAYDVKGVRDMPHALLAAGGDIHGLAALIASHQRPDSIDPTGLEEFRTSRVARWLEAHLEDVVG